MRAEIKWKPNKTDVIWGTVYLVFAILMNDLSLYFTMFACFFVTTGIGAPKKSN